MKLKKHYIWINIMILLLIISAAFFSTSWDDAPATALSDGKLEEKDAAILDRNAEIWADSLFNTLTQEERIAQLFMIRAHSDKGEDHIQSVENLVRTYKVGGLCFFQGTPNKQAVLTNRYQFLSKVPLLIGIDGEWGLGMRMKETTISFPRQLTLGAIQDNRLIYEFGEEVARECKRIGIHVNFAPVVDINNNPKNPVINSRSFGENRYNVAAKAYMYAKGMQDNGIMACAKHFPGHGDTDVDSHTGLPQIMHPYEHLDSFELFPFKVLAQHGVQSMMVAHLNVPALDDRQHYPTTLSEKTIDQLLKQKIGFNGLIFTDALEMQGVAKYFKSGEVEVKALQAGNDILTLPGSVPNALSMIKQAMQNGQLDESKVYASVKKLLKAKYKLGLNRYKPIDLENVTYDLNTSKAVAFKRKLYENALTLVRTKDNLIPIQSVENRSFGTLAMGTDRRTPFQNTINKYVANVEHFNVSKDIPDKQRQALINKLKTKSLVVISLHDLGTKPSNGFGLTEDMRTFAVELQKYTNVVLVSFGNPYCLKYFDSIENVLQAYEEDNNCQDLAAQALFGAFPITGKLPITASERSKYGIGMLAPTLGRLGYDLPERVGLNSNILESKMNILLDSIVTQGVAPGGQVLCAKDGKVVMLKPFGYQTYDQAQPVLEDDLYDLASVTKICSGTISMMKLVDEGKVSLNDKMSDYVPVLKGTNKENLTIDEIMAHHAGLLAWIKFYENTLVYSKKSKPVPSPQLYRSSYSPEFSIRVTDKLYLKTDYDKELLKLIATSELRTQKDYKYSDLGLYLTAEAIKNVSQEKIDAFAQEKFYRPLGLQTATYNPTDKFPLSRIAPTEEDSYFRMTKVQGYVHDMGAAMMGGVSGHAGLFADANDVAIILQMLLNEGQYGGIKFFKPETVRLFTTRFPRSSRRGIGFDMKELDGTQLMNMSPLAGANTFGHQGFTGICAWADPDNKTIFVFLSNRTYPTMRNNKLGKENYRERLHSVIYEAMM